MIKFADWYKWAGVLHMNIGAMTMFEFVTAISGYAESQGAKPKGGSISDDRLAEMGVEGF